MVSVPTLRETCRHRRTLDVGAILGDRYHVVRVLKKGKTRRDVAGDRRHVRRRRSRQACGREIDLPRRPIPTGTRDFRARRSEDPPCGAAHRSSAARQQRLYLVRPFVPGITLKLLLQQGPLKTRRRSDGRRLPVFRTQGDSRPQSPPRRYSPREHDRRGGMAAERGGARGLRFAASHAAGSSQQRGIHRGRQVSLAGTSRHAGSRRGRAVRSVFGGGGSVRVSCGPRSVRRRERGSAAVRAHDGHAFPS